jgi:thiol-disulfide isomerase/thioredoxin
MKRSNNPAGTNPGYTRRKALGLLGGSAALLGAGAAQRSAFAQGSDDVLTEALVLRDPDVPSTGNPTATSTRRMVRLHCPYCRKIAPEIQQVVQDDGKVRLVLKDCRSSARSRSSRRGWRWRRSIRTNTWPRMRR